MSNPLVLSQSFFPSKRQIPQLLGKWATMPGQEHGPWDPGHFSSSSKCRSIRKIYVLPLTKGDIFNERQRKQGSASRIRRGETEMRRKQLPMLLGMRMEFGSELPGSPSEKGSLIGYRVPLISKEDACWFLGGDVICSSFSFSRQ